jgi:hypothetical protein
MVLQHVSDSTIKFERRQRVSNADDFGWSFEPELRDMRQVKKLAFVFYESVYERSLPMPGLPKVYSP